MNADIQIIFGDFRMCKKAAKNIEIFEALSNPRA